MSEGKFLTVFPLPEGAEDEVTLLFESIAEKDESWVWGFKRVGGERKVVIYSRGKNQAKMRGNWLQSKTDLFNGIPYHTTHSLTLKTSLKEKPREVEGLRAILKRDRIWEKASKGKS